MDCVTKFLVAVAEISWGLLRVAEFGCSVIGAAVVLQWIIEGGLRW